MLLLQECIAILCFILPFAIASPTLSQYSFSIDARKHDLETLATGINSIYVFATQLASRGVILYKGWDGAEWHPSGHAWHTLGNADASSAPATASWEYNYVDVFAVSSTGSLLHKWFNKHSWRSSKHEYDTIAHVFLPGGKIAAIAPSSRRLHVFDLAANSHHLIHKYYDGSHLLLHKFEVENLGGKFIHGPSVETRSFIKGNLMIPGIPGRLNGKSLHTCKAWWNDYLFVEFLSTLNLGIENAIGNGAML